MTSLDPRALRNAFGSYMTGVTVVTTQTPEGQPVGFTANSFTSVSLDPPMLLVCPGRFLSSYDSFAQCSRFAVNVLAEGQEEVSNTFASFKGDRFAQVAHRIDDYGMPRIEGALAQFSCSTVQSLEVGDHSVLIGEVQAYEHRQGRGLGYAGGQYFSLGLERAALNHGTGRMVCGAIIEQDGHVLLERTSEGFRPPQVTLPDRGEQRRALVEDLAKRGLTMNLRSAYSVFDSGETRFAYLLATAHLSDAATPFEAIAISDLEKLSYTTPPIADMMARFATEARTGSFGFYLGDVERGDIHAQPERS